MPSTSRVAGASWPSATSPRIRTPPCCAMTAPPIAWLDELLFAEPQRQLLAGLFERLAGDELDAALPRGDEIANVLQPRLQGLWAEPQIGGRPGSDLLARRQHDPPGGGIARLAVFVADGQERRQRHLEGAEAVGDELLHPQAAILRLDGAEDSDAGQAEHLGKGGSYLAVVVVGSLSAAEDQVGIADLADEGAEGGGDHPGVCLTKGRVLDDVALVGAHGEGVLDDVSRRLRAD